MVSVRAIYREGHLVPLQPVSLAEGTEVQVLVSDSQILPPLVNDPVKRASILRSLVQRMVDNPIPANAPRLTRNELHERR